MARDITYLYNFMAESSRDTRTHTSPLTKTIELVELVFFVSERTFHDCLINLASLFQHPKSDDDMGAQFCEPR